MNLIQFYRMNIIEHSSIGEKKLLENYENMENDLENGVEEATRVEEATPETGVKHEEGMIDEEKPFDEE